MLASRFFINSGTLNFQAVGLLTKISKIFAILLTKSASLLTRPFLEQKSFRSYYELLDDWRDGYKEFLEINELDDDPNDENKHIDFSDSNYYT